MESPWPHSIHITPDSATIDMIIWAGKREETSYEDKAVKLLGIVLVR